MRTPVIQLCSGLCFFLSMFVWVASSAALPPVAGSAEGDSNVQLACKCGQYPGADSQGNPACVCQSGLVPAGSFGCAAACPAGTHLEAPLADPSKCADCVPNPPCGNDSVFAGGQWTFQCQANRVRISSNDTRCVEVPLRPGGDATNVCGPGFHLDCGAYDAGQAAPANRCCGCSPDACLCGTTARLNANGDRSCEALPGTEYFASKNVFDTACPLNTLPDPSNPNGFSGHPGGLGCIACAGCPPCTHLAGGQCVSDIPSCGAGMAADYGSCSCQCTNTWYSVDVNAKHLGFPGNSNIFAGNVPQCLNQYVQACGSDGKVNDGWPKYGGTTDDCVALYTLYGVPTGGGLPDALRFGVWGKEKGEKWDEFATKKHTLNLQYGSVKYWGGKNGGGVAAPLDGVSYFDAQCNRVPKEAYDGIAAQCKTGGTVRYMEETVDSPVSLLWTPDSSVEFRQFAKFPLNPEHADRWYEWKASPKTPLVVYDPAHRGEIAQASQLFGTAALGKKWKDGYEALASLDSNGDKKLSGAELNDLGLWFDNGDGVASPSEVKSLEGAGVTALYFQGGERSAVNGYVYLSHGFDRKSADGKRDEQGKSVDWFANSYGADPMKNAADETNSASGAWAWKTTEVKSSVPHASELVSAGVLTLADMGDTIEGHSYTEIPVLRTRGGRDERGSAVRAAQLSGTQERHSDGSTALRWETLQRSSGNRTLTEATLSGDHRHLSGSSKLVDEAGQVLLEYQWSAERAG